MHPIEHARTNPDKAAHIMASSGEIVTYAQLEERSARFAQLLWAQGLRPGDTIAAFMENHPRYLEIAWAALRSGLYLTPVNRYLGVKEAAYIVDDCHARVLVISPGVEEVGRQIVGRATRVERFLVVDAAVDGFERYEDLIALHPPKPLDQEPLGDLMLYSSGTTGRPKGVRFPLTGRMVSEGHELVTDHWIKPYDFGPDSIFLCTAPLYHSMPIWDCILTQAVGATAVIMERFEPDEALACVERYRVTHGYFVPTMFVRMLKLDAEKRARYDLSSLRVAIHSAAPCSPEVKKRMIEWWGPCLVETYGGTESSAACYIQSEEWLRHPGSVGKVSEGHQIHIVDEEGRELPPGDVGIIYFSGASNFEYFNDPEKTRAAFNDRGWQALGDMGYVDEEGYLYLTDRKDFMIVSGGVNIYPQEAENVLIEHPAVSDVAVFGVPNPDFGEEVKAAVELAEGVEASTALGEEILEFCRSRLAHYKCPRSVDFEEEFPRLPTGKLYKRKLRDRYWDGHETRIV
jgi:fatty-acyl-CoA synthase